MIALSESRHEKSRGAPPGGEITMKSYPACNKTSLSRKPRIPDKKRYYGTLSGNHDRSFIIRHKKSCGAPLVEKSGYVISGLQ